MKEEDEVKKNKQAKQMSILWYQVQLVVESWKTLHAHYQCGKSLLVKERGRFYLLDPLSIGQSFVLQSKEF